MASRASAMPRNASDAFSSVDLPSLAHYEALNTGWVHPINESLFLEISLSKSRIGRYGGVLNSLAAPESELSRRFCGKTG